MALSIERELVKINHLRKYQVWIFEWVIFTLSDGVWYFFGNLKKLTLLFSNDLENKFCPHLTFQNKYSRYISWVWTSTGDSYLNIKFNFFYFNKFMKLYKSSWKIENWVVNEFYTIWTSFTLLINISYFGAHLRYSTITAQFV